MHWNTDIKKVDMRTKPRTSNMHRLIAMAASLLIAAASALAPVEATAKANTSVGSFSSKKQGGDTPKPVADSPKKTSAGFGSFSSNRKDGSDRPSATVPPSKTMKAMEAASAKEQAAQALAESRAKRDAAYKQQSNEQYQGYGSEPTFAQKYPSEAAAVSRPPAYEPPAVQPQQVIVEHHHSGNDGLLTGILIGKALSGGSHQRYYDDRPVPVQQPSPAIGSISTAQPSATVDHDMPPAIDPATQVGNVEQPRLSPKSDQASTKSSLGTAIWVLIACALIAVPMVLIYRRISAPIDSAQPRRNYTFK